MKQGNLLEFDQERFEEQSAVMEFDGGLPRLEAERLAREECENHRSACEVRHILTIPSLSARQEYLALVEEKRGKAAADRLREDVRAWRPK